MKRPRFNLDDSWVSITIGLVVAALITLFLTGPSLAELKQWTWDALLGHTLGLVLVVMMGFAMSFGLAEQMMKDDAERPIQRSRPASYALCLLILFAVSVGLGAMWSTAIEPGDELDGTGRVATTYVPGKSLAERDAMIQKIFLAFLAPCLLGVRGALGPKTKSKPG